MFIFPVHCVRATQTGVYLVAERFGFQQFNFSPTTKEWVTATAGVAADQLVALLRDAAVRRCSTNGRPAEMREAWEAAVADVHEEYFEEYQLWQTQLQLPDPHEHQDQQQQQQGRQQRRSSTAGGAINSPPTPQLLLELSLQFLIYAEAANLRHTPHLLFLVYYIMRGSTPFQEALCAYTAGQPRASSSGGLSQQQQQQAALSHTHWLYWLNLAASDFPDKPSGYDLTSLRRNLLQQLYYTCPAAFHYPDPSAPVVENSESLLLSKAEQEQALDDAQKVMLHPTMTAPRHRAMVEDMLQQLRQLFKGNGQQVFLNQVVQPLFFFLAEQIDLAGQQGQEEAALRIAYCDVDECCCSPSAVHKVLGALKSQAYAHLLPGSKDLWHALLHVMKPPSGWLLATAALEQPPASEAAHRSRWSRLMGNKTSTAAASSTKDRYPRDAQRVKALDNLALLLQRNQGGDAAAAARIKQEQDQALRHVIAQGFPALTNESEALTWVHQRAKHGANWWAANLLKAKTFVEARSIAAPFVAFWRVYDFHAVLFTAMVAVSFVLRLKAPGGAGWLQLAAAFALTTVTDGLMRVVGAAARLLLLSYQTPVFRTQAGTEKRFVINPYTMRSWIRTLPQLVYMLFWLAWTSVLGFSVVPVLLQRDVTFIQGLSRSLHSSSRPLWLIPVAVHALLLWCGALLRQRAGYVTSWSGMWHDWQRKLKRRGQYGRGAMAAAHADCASDKAIDALFYPSSNLAVGKERWMVNTLLWVVVVLVKVVFEFFCIVQPLTYVMLEIIAHQESFMSTAIQADAATSGLVTASTVVTIAAMSVPTMLLSLSDTGLIFSLVGGAFSAAVGFKRGMGSIKSWFDMVSRFNILLDNYKQHCISRSGLALHLHGRSEADMQQLCLAAFAAGWNALAYDLRQRDLLSNRELACIAFEQLQLDEQQLAQAKARGLTTVLPARCFMAGAVPALASGVVGSDHHLRVAKTCWSWFCWLAYQTMLINEQELRGLSTLQLLYPPNDRQQQQRWAKLLSESVCLLRLLHTPISSPSNTAAAAAAAAKAAADDPFVAGKPVGAAADGKGLLHGAPTDELARPEAWRDLTSCMASLIKTLDKEAADLESARRNYKDTYASFFTKPPPLNEAEITLVVNALNSLKDRWTPWLNEARTAMLQRAEMQGTRPMPPRQLLTTQQTRLRNQMDAQLDRMQEVGRVSSAVAQVAGWLADVLVLLPGDTVPGDEEAVKFILNFAASLNDPGLKLAPSIHVMPSLTTLTPHYDEDVIYALNEPDAMGDLQARAAARAAQQRGANSRLFPSDASKMASRDKVVYLMTPDGSPTPTMTYLRSVYCSAKGGSTSQWENFVERVLALALARGDVDMAQLPSRINEFHFLPGEPLHKLKDELLLWASCRGQLLARTVRGMMSYRAALAALADYENPQFSDTAAPIGLRPSSCGEGVRAGSSRVSDSNNAAGVQQIQQADIRAVILEDLLDCKYSYVVSSQNLGEFASKTTADLKAAWLVHAMQLLRVRHPSLKVAFIDKQKLVLASRPGHKVELRRDSSVLLCSERQRKIAAAIGVDVEEEAYRVQLPINFESERGVILGEGKPENQNHAVIFCHSETLQTIDCNQDNVVAEGLKLRNLLAEFMPEGWDQPQSAGLWSLANAQRRFNNILTGDGTAAAGRGSSGGVDNSKLLGLIPRGKGRVALVGFREWVFSEDSGALAEFAAATEKSFGTTVQRLMHYPGACRFHYGHPDVWRRSFVATCGGVSKANKALHVSEDVFGGYNVMQRGRDITYVDYIAVGKGRDMGFETINTFEAKIAAGNGEQVLSREIRRLGHSMDFARLMSWYHTGNGFFINTALTMLSVHASLWVLLLLAFEKQQNSAVQQWMSAVQLLQLGSLSVVVYWLTLALDVGLFRSVWIILRQMLQGSLMFYVFRAQTSAFNFIQDLMFGGAKYLPTGRGYKLQHSSYKDIWRRFGRSHMYFGAVLLQYSLAVIAAGKLQGAGLLLLWAPMLVVVSLLIGPFWFTPFAFRMKNVTDDLEQTQQWFMSPSITDSWQTWNKEWSDTAANSPGRQMGRLATCLRAHFMKLPSLLLILAATSRMDTRHDSKLPKWAVALVLAGGVLLLVSLIQGSRRWAAGSAMKYQGPRLINMFATLFLAGGIAASGFATSGNVFEFGNAALVFFGTVLLLRLLPLVFYNPILRRWMYGLVNAVYYAADWSLAVLLLSTRFVLSLFDVLTSLQAQLLFNTAYARQVMSDSSMESSQVPQLITQALKLKRQRRMQ